jgi:hypothetical protein
MHLSRSFALTLAAVGGAICLASNANAGGLFTFSDGSGLSAEAEWTMIGPSTLQIRLKNTSTGGPGGMSNSDQILTGLSWDFGHPGFNGDVMILSGSVVIGPNSQSLNFDTGSYGPGYDVSGEWGFGNMDGTGALTNFISSSQAQATPFGGPNLDGPVNIDGPQAGLVAATPVVPLGGIGAIADEIVATIQLDGPYTQQQLLTDLLRNGVRVEFGSDYRFIPGEFVPAPGALALLLVAGGLTRSRRRAA